MKIKSFLLKNKVDVSLDSFFAFVISVFSLLFAFLTNIVIADSFSKSEMGKWILFIQTSVILSSFFAMGIPSTLTYFVGQNKKQAFKISIYLLSIQFVTNVILFGCFLFFKPFLVNNIFNGIDNSVWIQLFLFSIFLTLNLSFSGILKGLSYVPLANIINKIVIVMKFVGLMVLLFCNKLTLINYINIILISVFFLDALILVLLLLFSFKKNRLDNTKKLIPVNNTFKLSKVFIYAISVLSGNLLLSINGRIGIYLINIFNNNLEDIAYFGFALSLIQKISILPTSIGGTIFTKIATNKHCSRNDIILYSRILILISFVVILMVDIFSIPFFYLFSDGSYWESSGVFIVLSLGFLFLVPSYVTFNYFSGTGKAYIPTVILFFSLVVSVISSIYFIPRFSIYGACISYALSNLCNTVLSIYFLKKYMDITLVGMVIPRKNDFKIISNKIYSLFN